MLSQPYISVQYVRYQVQATVDGVPHDPTGDVVKFGFVPKSQGQLTPTTWVNGSWETIGGSVFVARCLVGAGVGAGGFDPPARDDYKVWVKIADNPETPVIYVGDLRIW